MIQLSKNQFNAFKSIELEGEIIFWGRIADILEANKVFKFEAKDVLDSLNINNKRLRHFIYEQLDLRGLS